MSGFTPGTRVAHTEYAWVGTVQSCPEPWRNWALVQWDHSAPRGGGSRGARAGSGAVLTNPKRLAIVTEGEG